MQTCWGFQDQHLDTNFVYSTVQVKPQLIYCSSTGAIKSKATLLNAANTNLTADMVSQQWIGSPGAN